MGTSNVLTFLILDTCTSIKIQNPTLSL